MSSRASGNDIGFLGGACCSVACRALGPSACQFVRGPFEELNAVLVREPRFCEKRFLPADAVLDDLQDEV